MSGGGHKVIEEGTKEEKYKLSERPHPVLQGTTIKLTVVVLFAVMEEGKQWRNIFKDPKKINHQIKIL